MVHIDISHYPQIAAINTVTSQVLYTMLQYSVIKSHYGFVHRLKPL